MSASLFWESIELEPRRWEVPGAALLRLRHHLSLGQARDEVWEASLRYGVPWNELNGMVEHWLYDFALEQQPLFDLPCFELGLAEQPLRFLRLRSSQSSALPLLLLHGYSGSPAEFRQLFGPLTEPRQYGAEESDAFDVVCPCLPTLPLSSATSSARQAANAYADLMRALGYTRYAVHGSDLGANIALELAALDADHVVGLHVTALPAYPSDTPEDLLTLDEREKSQLAGARERHEELQFSLPETPIQGLAFALAQLADSPARYQDATVQAALLTSLSLLWAGAAGAPEARSRLYRQARLAAAPASDVPIALQDFPLDAPSVRRFAERAHRVVEWREHERGGPVPGLEQPELLLESLRACFRLRR